MSSQIIGLTPWLATAPGRYLLDWEKRHFDETVSDIFGYHALQLGLPQLQGLRSNRMPHRWLALDAARELDAASKVPPATDADGPQAPRVALLTHPAALPFPENSLDLVLLPHTLELSQDPHGTLREVERVLVPEGKLVISGLNPASLWGFRQRRAHWWRRLGLGELYLPEDGEFIGYWRLRDWLRLLSFEVESARFGCWRPALRSERWWPIFGSAYFLVAVKRVRGMRLLEPGWRARPQRAAAPAVAARRQDSSTAQRGGS